VNPPTAAAGPNAPGCWAGNICSWSVVRVFAGSTQSTVDKIHCRCTWRARDRCGWPSCPQGRAVRPTSSLQTSGSLQTSASGSRKFRRPSRSISWSLVCLRSRKPKKKRNAQIIKNHEKKFVLWALLYACIVWETVLFFFCARKKIYIFLIVSIVQNIF